VPAFNPFSFCSKTAVELFPPLKFGLLGTFVVAPESATVVLVVAVTLPPTP
jgi:hypothetical protein